jgi:hypothetical protein
MERHTQLLIERTPDAAIPHRPTSSPCTAES